MADLGSLFKRHARVHIAFSGGKDPLALLDLCSRWRDQLVLVWGNTGIMWPHMEQFIRGYARQYRFIEAAPELDVLSHWRLYGLPADVLPVDNALEKPRTLPKLQPWTACCAAMRVNPVIAAGIKDGMTALLHGQRQGDGAFPNHQDWGGHVLHVETVGALWEWSQDDVWRYLTERASN